VYADFSIIRRSRSLVLSFDEQGLVAFDFIRRKTAHINQIGFALLSCTTSWIDSALVFTLLQPSFYWCCIADELSKLIDLGFILIQGTEEAKRDELYESKWVWGAMAGHYHFGIKDPYYMNPEETTAWLSNQVSTTPPVPLCLTNEGLVEVMRLPPPSFDREVFSVMLERRSYRGFDPNPEKAVTLEQLRDCLFFGLGITGFIETPMAELGQLPMKTTPSAGARNPYEAYVYARNVKGLRRGIYHYSALDNTLGLIRDYDLPTVGDILAVQPWFDNAGALLLLVANFERTMWKYPHPTGFRVVLLEAGHIAQNVLLAATANGLASAPTSAVSDSLAQNLIGLDPITQSVIYTIAIGVRSDVPTVADTSRVVANPYLQGAE
jgi:SagB-type dehydrogenase family enzyme